MTPAPITNPQWINGCFVFRATWEEQKRIAAWNWANIYKLAAELQKRKSK